METITFLFALDETVETPFGQKGIVSMLGYDEGGKQYFVKTKEGGSWFKEAQIKKAVAA